MKIIKQFIKSIKASNAIRSLNKNILVG